MTDAADLTKDGIVLAAFEGGHQRVPIAHVFRYADGTDTALVAAGWSISDGRHTRPAKGPLVAAGNGRWRAGEWTLRKPDPTNKEEVETAANWNQAGDEDEKNRVIAHNLAERLLKTKLEP